MGIEAFSQREEQVLRTNAACGVRSGWCGHALGLSTGRRCLLRTSPCLGLCLICRWEFSPRGRAAQQAECNPSGVPGRQAEGWEALWFATDVKQHLVAPLPAYWCSARAVSWNTGTHMQTHQRKESPLTITADTIEANRHQQGGIQRHLPLAGTDAHLQGLSTRITAILQLPATRGGKKTFGPFGLYCAS